MAKIPEADRLYAMCEYERGYWERGVFPCGMDEVGRGPLAGPVVVGCAVMPPKPLIEYVNDSKKLSEKRREELYPQLTGQALAYSTAWVDERVIDEINILNAVKLAFKQAYEKLPEPPDAAFIDAVTGLDIAAEQISIIHGDAKSYLIAAASIIAKVERDAYMLRMHELYPQYGFDKNKGYGTAQHIAALREHGPCPIHRRSFIGGILNG